MLSFGKWQDARDGAKRIIAELKTKGLHEESHAGP